MPDEIDFSAEMQNLADIASQYAPENWEKMNLCFELYSPGNYGIDAWAEIGGERIPVDFDEDDIDNLEKVFEIIRKKSIEKWNVAIFEFSSSGDCELNFKY